MICISDDTEYDTVDFVETSYYRLTLADQYIQQKIVVLTIRSEIRKLSARFDQESIRVMCLNTSHRMTFES